MNSLGKFTIKRPGIIITAAIILTTIAAVYGLSVFDRLQSSGGFEDPKSSSAQAQAIIDSRFSEQRTDVLVLFTSPRQPVTDPTISARVRSALERIRTTAGVAAVTSNFNTGSPSFISSDQHQMFATIRLAGNETAQSKTLHLLQKRISSNADLQIGYGGIVAVNDQINQQVAKDLEKAELLSFPILAILLIIVFRSVVAALIPLTLGALSILVAFLIIRLLTDVTTISVYAINIITLMGLGLAIDYSLFIVSRFREELAGGKDVPAAISATMNTAGRTVFFSALTVIISLLGLMVFPQNFLRSMGLGGAAAVAATAILALTVLPAALRLVGRHVNDIALPGLHKKLARPTEHGPWYRYSRFIMRYPLLTLAVALELLAILALPFLSARFSTPNASTIPQSYSSRQVYDQLQANFENGGASRITLAIKTPATASDPATQAILTKYLDTLKHTGGITETQILGTSDNYIYATLTENYPPQSTNAIQTVRDIRAVSVPAGWEVKSGGETATLIDLLHGLEAKIPLAGLIILLTTSILMFLMLGSVVMPIKAVIINVLSLSAAFGLLTWIFQDGHLVAPLGFVSNGTIDATQPILIFAIAFGLAMDYELFLLSRIKEEYDRTGDNKNAVAIGVERTAGIITSAALMLVVVIGLFATGKISIIQQVGIGLGAAVAIDATIVRLLLVPSAMELLGRFNWWAPAPLAQFAKKLGISEA